MRRRADTCARLGILLYFVIPRVPSELRATDAGDDWLTRRAAFAFFSAQPLLAVPNAGGMSTTYTPTRSFS